MLKPLSLTADNSVPVSDGEEESRLNSILIMGDCVGARLTLGVVLRYGYCKLVITNLGFPTKYCYSVFLRKNDSLGAFCSILAMDWVCYRFMNVNGVAYEEEYGLEFCERMCSEVWLGKPRMVVASDLTNWSAVVKRLGYI